MSGKHRHIKMIQDDRRLLAGEVHEVGYGAGVSYVQRGVAIWSDSHGNPVDLDSDGHVIKSRGPGRPKGSKNRAKSTSDVQDDE